MTLSRIIILLFLFIFSVNCRDYPYTDDPKVIERYANDKKREGWHRSACDAFLRLGRRYHELGEIYKATDADAMALPECLLTAEGHGEAVMGLDASCKYHPKVALAYEGQGIFLKAGEMYELAARSCTMLATVDRNHGPHGPAAEAYLNAARVYLEANRLEQAKQMYLNAASSKEAAGWPYTANQLRDKAEEVEDQILKRNMSSQS